MIKIFDIKNFQNFNALETRYGYIFNGIYFDRNFNFISDITQEFNKVNSLFINNKIYFSSTNGILYLNSFKFAPAKFNNKKQRSTILYQDDETYYASPIQNNVNKRSFAFKESEKKFYNIDLNFVSSYYSIFILPIIYQNKVYLFLAFGYKNTCCSNVNYYLKNINTSLYIKYLDRFDGLHLPVFYVEEDNGFIFKHYYNYRGHIPYYYNKNLNISFNMPINYGFSNYNTIFSNVNYGYIYEISGKSNEFAKVNINNGQTEKIFENNYNIPQDSAQYYTIYNNNDILFAFNYNNNTCYIYNATEKNVNISYIKPKTSIFINNDIETVASFSGNTIKIYKFDYNSLNYEIINEIYLPESINHISQSLTDELFITTNNGIYIEPIFNYSNRYKISYNINRELIDLVNNIIPIEFKVFDNVLLNEVDKQVKIKIKSSNIGTFLDGTVEKIVNISKYGTKLDIKLNTIGTLEFEYEILD